MPELTNENEKTTKKTTAAKKSTTAKPTAKQTTKKTVAKKVDEPKKTTSKKTSTTKVASTAKKSTTKSPAKKETALKTSKTTTSKVTPTKTTKKETVASKAVKDAKEKVVKDNLKKELDKVEAKKVETKVGKKEDNKVKKEETIIQKIKNFIAKIVAMQEEARKENENKKALQESIKDDIESTEENSESKNKYMLEYYDLPYRYNETVVKILAQTPKRLFVYWDISDSDREKFKEAFGENFFEATYPVLLVHNEEMNYTFEVPINDFANSWYLDISDPKSKYVIQLGRKFKAKPEFVNIAVTSNGSTIEIQNDYVPITTSNILEVPNDHILFEKVGTKALYRNIKTNEESYLEIANAEFMKKMGNIYSIYDLYKEIYKNELGDGSLTDLLNPSSMSSSGTNSSMFR